MNHINSTANENHSEVLDYNIEWPAWSVESLKSLATNLKLPRPRSLAWAILLNALPPPNGSILNSLKSHRKHYDDLSKKLSTDPRAVVGDDPLSQNDESAWNQHFCDNELKALILQDVVRTFPDELYFRDKDVQDMMVRVLFFWSRTHEAGYRQGMHEVLAPLLLELNMDRRMAPAGLSDLLKYYLKEDCLEHDSYMLFSTLMKGLVRFYATGDVVPSPNGRLPTSTSVHNPNEVVRYLDRIRTEHLMTLDPELASHLADCNISLELFGIRWLRLLFGREFPRGDVPLLWGFLFSDGPSLPNVHHMLLAMLISVRTLLLDRSAGVALSALMRPLAAPLRPVAALALHLRAPATHKRPPPPALHTVDDNHEKNSWSIEETLSTDSQTVVSLDSDADAARSLAALALLRARLPAAVRALTRALPPPQPNAVAAPLQQLVQLASLLECRNHALIDVETALEAAEGDSPSQELGRRQIVPVTLNARKKAPLPKSPKRIKEYQLKVFHQGECAISDNLPCLDPLRIRTD